MNQQIQTTNNVRCTNTLAKSNPTINDEKPNVTHSIFTSNMTTCNNNDDIQLNFLAMDKQNRMNANRYTYGAYTNNTLPRGPYLQYKYNDQQPASKTTLNSGENDMLSASSIDNNELRQKQIEQLKKEFFCLPRARVQTSYSSSDRKYDKCDDRQQEQQHIYSNANYNEKNSIKINGQNHQHNRDKDENDNENHIYNDNNSNINCNSNNDQVLKVQTLGRYKQNTRGKKSHHDCVSNLEYFYSDSNSSNRLMMTNRNSNNSSPKYFDEQKQHDYQQYGIASSRSISNFNNDLKIWNVYDDKIKSSRLKYTNDFDTHNENNSNKSQIIQSHTERNSNSIGIFNRNREVKSNTRNFVFLSDVLKVKTNGVTHIEGWALLCQSVQALQDLFLSGKQIVLKRKKQKQT